MRRDLTNTAILWFCLTIVAELFAPYLPFPTAAAAEALTSDESFRALLTMGVPVFTFVVSVLAYSLWKFRATGEAPEDGTPTPESGWVTGLWLGITSSLCLLMIVNPGLTGMAKMFDTTQQPQLEVRIVGHQWNWEVDYPAQGLAGVAELVLPVDQRVKFSVTSADVLHAFWIPAFRNKVDAIPGQITTMYATPNQLASFADDFNMRVQCTEICGKSHATMSMPVRVVSGADFQAWMEAQLAAMPSNPISRGQRLAQSQGCSKCHSTDGTAIAGGGPTWKDLYMSEVPLADGATVTADDAYLHESIVNPSAQIVQGFEDGLMPQKFGALLGDDQIQDLIDYIESLSPAGNHIEANLYEYVIDLSHGAAREGEVTFSIKNNSTTMMHELIILKTDLTPAQLPLNSEGNVDEDKFTEDPAAAVDGMLWKVGALEDIEAGQGGDLTIHMPAGHYVMICNKPGHFKLGMVLEFTVVP